MSSPQAPFPYAGGKRRVADLVWDHFREIHHYVEPFCGSAAVLLSRPGGAPESGAETINDHNGLLINFWRAIKQSPQKVLEFAKAPPSAVELPARNERVRDHLGHLVDQLIDDPTWYHPQIAADWWYCISTAIGTRALFNDDEQMGPTKPFLGAGGRGVHASRINADHLQQLADRLSGVRILCHDWTDCLTSGAIRHAGTPVGIFLDPPYEPETYYDKVYDGDIDGVAEEVYEWAIEHGDDSDLRIAYCGYAETFEFPDTWESFEWSAHGGHRHIGEDAEKTRHNERIWFSQHCRKQEQRDLFGSHEKAT